MNKAVPDGSPGRVGYGSGLGARLSWAGGGAQGAGHRTQGTGHRAQGTSETKRLRDERPQGARPQDCKTARLQLQDRKTARPPRPQTARPQDCKTARPQDRKTMTKNRNRKQPPKSRCLYRPLTRLVFLLLFLPYCLYLFPDPGNYVLFFREQQSLFLYSMTILEFLINRVCDLIAKFLTHFILIVSRSLILAWYVITGCDNARDKPAG